MAKTFYGICARSKSCGDVERPEDAFRPLSPSMKKDVHVGEERTEDEPKRPIRDEHYKTILLQMIEMKAPQLTAKIFLNGPTPASFCLFSFFSNTNIQKNFRFQRDSNSDRRS